MTRSTARSRAGGRARLAAAVVCAALALPGLAVASHTTCTNTGFGTECPPMNVDLLAGPQVAYTSAWSGLDFRFTMADHNSPVMDATYLVPKGWGFAVESIRPARRNDGVTASAAAPATCDDSPTGIYTARGGNTAATLRDAENLAGGVGFQGRVGATRADNGGTLLNFGLIDRINNTTRQRPSLAFTYWDSASQTAHLCLYAYAGQSQANDSNAGGSQYVSSENELPREHRIPITLTKLAPGNTFGSQFGWAINLSMTSFMNDASLFTDNLSIIQGLFYIEGLTGGNWNTNPVTGQLERMFFSRTPVDPGTYEFKGIFKTCRNGYELYGYGSMTGNPGRVIPPSFNHMCKGGVTAPTVTIERSRFVDIIPPPAEGYHDYGKLTGPSTAGLPNGFGFVRNADSLTITWRQPAPNNFEDVKGYVLYVARPNDQSAIHSEYIVTDETYVPTSPSDPAFDTRAPCDDAAPTSPGIDGDDVNCELTLQFPLTANYPPTGGTSKIMTADDKYDIVLVTVYKDGHRTDSDPNGANMCDNGTAEGMKCPVTMRDFRVIEPGFTQWQVLMRTDAWPLAYASTTAVRGNCCPAGNAPNQVLLLDLALRKGELIMWNAMAPATSYAAPGNLMFQVAEAGNRFVFNFDNGKLFTPDPAWRVFGNGDPNSASVRFSKYDSNHPLDARPQSFSLSKI